MPLTNKELLDEIKLLHKKLDKVSDQVNDVRSELSLFKGKALGFMAIVSIIFNAGIALFNKKL